jgi:hypothetical protein
MAKIFIGTPMFGGQCTGVYVQSIIGLMNLFSQKGHQVSAAFMFNESLITRARCNMTHQFLKTDHDYLFWIDADIKFRPEDALRMLEADKDIIGGIYPKKEINWGTVRDAALRGEQNLAAHTGSFVVNLPYGKTSVTVKRDEPTEVMYVGTGFMLIKRKVLDPICSESNRLLSEDYYFCQQWINHGGKIYAAPWCQLGHMGTYLFEGNLIGTEEPCDEPRVVTRRTAVGSKEGKDPVGNKDRSGGSKDNRRGGKDSGKDGAGDRPTRSTSSSPNRRKSK